jgi:hypothetical protein
MTRHRSTPLSTRQRPGRRWPTLKRSGQGVLGDPAAGTLSGNRFIPFRDYDVEIRRVLCSTNAIESLSARYSRAVTTKGHFPTEQAALKSLYLVTRSLDPRAPDRHDGSPGGSPR